MKKNWLILFLFPVICFGQKQSDHLGEIQAMKQARIDTMISVIRISKSDIVADIGSGKGYNLVRLSKYFPPIRYHVEDIDSTVCNRANFKKSIQAFNPAISIDSFVFHYGTVRATGLPRDHFTKVLMIAVLHEFDFRNEMLADIRSILKENGDIYLEEPLVFKPAKKDKGCNNPYLTETELKKILQENKLMIVSEKYIGDRSGNQYRKIFHCKKTG